MAAKPKTIPAAKKQYMTAIHTCTLRMSALLQVGGTLLPVAEGATHRFALCVPPQMPLSSLDSHNLVLSGQHGFPEAVRFRLRRPGCALVRQP